ncbi:ArsI/CadI family heavy metal resistance metalloenzyme [Roseivirga misakiensis]|uniref:Glyoxalase n=1 Tax=Roseivirga misakiensis TaxID=1563681 RepID=A0A1E5T095_9BACT|nr:ArsI/CadI family heavy metal resistance metalloenzyme [Roseivirga misakiensis]OEK04727.1 glyoxalase [Roseivirga misakiensis]
MKRIHINLSVKDVQRSIEFYSALFGTSPSFIKQDYAKWLLNDPSVNFSISQTPGVTGINHLGIQADNEEELSQLYHQVGEAKGKVRNEGDTICCYAHSNKQWIKDPQDVEWEMFYTYGQTEVNKVATKECCDDNCCQV